MKKTNLFFGLRMLSVFSILFLSSKALATTIVSAGTGDWSATATWVGGQVPGVNDTVTITSTHLITLASGTATVSAINITLNDGLISGNKGLTIASGATLTVTGGITIKGGTVNTLSSTLTNNGTLNCGGKISLLPSNTNFANAGDPSTAIFVNDGVANLFDLEAISNDNSNLEIRCLTASITNIDGNVNTAAPVGYGYWNILGTAVVNARGVNSSVIIGQYVAVAFTGTGKLNLPSRSSTLSIVGNGASINMGSAASEIHTKGAINAALPTAFVPGLLSTVFYESDSAQTIAPLNYRNLVSTSTGPRAMSQTGIVGIAGTFTRGTNNYTLNGSTIAYNGTGAQYIEKFDYFNLTISGARGGTNITLCPDTIGLAGVFVYSATGVGTVINTNNTFKFNGLLDQEMQAFPFNNIYVYKPNNSVCFTRVNNNTVIAGSLTVDKGVFRLGRKTTTIIGQSAPYTFTTTGTNQTILVKDSATLEVDGSSAFAAPYPMTFANHIYETGSTLLFSSDLAQTVPAGLNLYHLKSNSPTVGPRTFAAGKIIVRGDLTDIGANTYTTTGSEISFEGTTNQAINGNVGVGTNGFSKLTVNKSAGNLMINAATTVNDTLKLLNGMVDLNQKELILTLANKGAITVLNGSILCESPTFASKVTWNIGTDMEAHVFPFVTQTGTAVPVEFKLTTGNASNITISTYPTGMDNTPLPATVTGIDGQGATDADSVVVNRFWNITASNTVIAKTATVKFNSTIQEAYGIDSLKARMWNGTVWSAATAGQTATMNSVETPGLTTFGIFAVYGENGDPNPTYFSAPQQGVCAGTNVDFLDESYVSATAWSWSFPGADVTSSTVQNPSITYSTPGVYSVTLRITHSGGEVDSLTLEDFISVYASPMVTVTPDMTICNGETVTLSASGATNYAWSTGEFTADVDVSPTTTTTYSVTGDDGGICETTKDITVTVKDQPVATIDFTSLTVCKDSLITISGSSNVPGVGYSWNFDGAQSNGTTSASHDVVWSTLGAKNILLVVTDGNCQSDPTTFNLTVENCTVGVDELNSVDFALFPNPAKDMVIINLNNVADFQEAVVYTLTGKVVMTETSTSFSVAQLAGGTYYVKVITSNGQNTKKLVVID